MLARRIVAFALQAVVATALCSGCRELTESSIPAKKADSPEADLEIVMKRLNEAISDAEAAEGSGVVSQRKSSYRLLPPSGSEAQYRAEVAILTIRSLAKVPAAKTLPKKPTPKEPTPFDFEESPEDASAEVATAPKPRQPPAGGVSKEQEDNGATQRAIAESLKSIKHTYELVYQDGRWELPKKPDDEVAAILFEYALAGQ